MTDEQDWTNVEHVTGAVWAQLEDLSLADKMRVIASINAELIAPNERVRRGETVVEHYRVHYDVDEPDGDVLSDLLADLIHWAAATDVDFDSRLDLARYHYDEESEGGET